MRIRLQFAVINNILKIFLLLLSLLFFSVFVLFWFFRMDITAKGEGKVICADWVDIKPEIRGVIKSMEVKEADPVKKDDLLFVLEDREIKMETESSHQKTIDLQKNMFSLEQKILIRKKSVANTIAEAEAGLSEVLAELKIVSSGPKTEEINLAKRSMKRAGQQVEKTFLDYERVKKAFLLKLMSQQDLDDAVHRRKIAQTDLAIAEDQLALLKNKYDENQLDSVKARVARQKAVLANALNLRKEVDILKKEFKAAREAFHTEQKRLEALKKKLKLTKICAPIPGIVMTYDTTHLKGRSVSKGEIVLKIGNTEKYLIECQIPEKDYSLVRKGQKARIAIKPFPKGEYRLFQATVETTGVENKERKASFPDGMGDKLDILINGVQTLKTTYYPVTLSLEKPYHMMLFGNRYEIRPGFSASVQIVVEDERIVELLLKRVLRIKGKLTMENIHL